MGSSNDLWNSFNGPFPGSRDSLFPYPEQPLQVTDSEICPFFPSTPEIRITPTASDNCINVDGSDLFRCPEAYPASIGITSDTHLVTQTPDNALFSINNFHLNSTNMTDLNFFNADFLGQGFHPYLVPFPQNGTSSRPTQKCIEVDNENEVPTSLSVRRRQSPVIPLVAQTINSSAMPFAGQLSFLAAGNDYGPSEPTPVMPRRNSSPPILTSSGLVASPAPLSTTWRDGDQICYDDQSTPDGEKNQRRYISSSRFN